jgi:hypothetical protein
MDAKIVQYQKVIIYNKLLHNNNGLPSGSICAFDQLYIDGYSIMKIMSQDYELNDTLGASLMNHIIESS